jgi:hypothetical protein
MTLTGNPIEAPTTARWWPSRYGEGDQAGALNEITPAKVAHAASLVRTGVVHDLAHVLHQDIPTFPGRSFRQYLTTNAHLVNRRRPGAGERGWGRNNVDWIVEQVTATQQMGTHLDALNHLQDGDRTYNGHRLADIAEEYGTNTLGVDTHLNTRHGVVVVENRRLRDLAAAGVHEFMLVISHAKLRGATGAWVAPLAIV